jgi:hypothetical protein
LLLGVEASWEVTPWLDDEDVEGAKEDEPRPVPPVAPEPPEESCCPFREALCPAWSRTTDENGAPAR